MDFLVRTFRLASHPHESGLWCGAEGLMLAGRPLLEKTAAGFVPANPYEIQRIFNRAFGEATTFDANTYLPGLASVARSLNKGDIPLAMIGSVLLKLPEIPQLRVADTKLAYDDSEARDEIGRWTSDGTAEAKSRIAAEAEEVTSAEATTTSEVAAGETTVAEAAIASETAAGEVVAVELAPETIGLLAILARLLPGPVSLAAATLLPTNKSNIHEGEFPDFPGLHYRSDEGVVTISRLDASGNIETLYQGVPDKDGFYHDNNGYIIGQHVGTGVMFDNEALADLTTQDATDTGDGEISPLPATEDSDGKACPNPTPENIKGRSNRSLAYQEQITGLPRGLDINHQGVRFDGCDNDTGRMQEAKGLGMDWMLNWPRDKLNNSKFYLRMMRQAGRQNNASQGRGDDYYFASKRMSDFFGAEFKKAGYSNITVHQVDAIVKKIVALLSGSFMKPLFFH